MIFVILFYCLFAVCVGIFAWFVFYHLRRYSINPRLTRPLGILFLVVTTALLLVNMMAFFAIPFDDIFRSSLQF